MGNSNGASSQRCLAHRFTAVSPPPPLALSPVLRVKQLHIRITFQCSTSLSSLFCCQTLNDCGGTYARTTVWSGRCLDIVQGCKSATQTQRRSSPRTSVKMGAGKFSKSSQMHISERYLRCIRTCSFTVHGAAAVPEGEPGALVNNASKAFLKTGRHPFTFKSVNMGHQSQFGSLKKHKVEVVMSAC